MPIRVSHTPISSALNLGQQAGRGDDFRFRVGAERQVVQDVLQSRRIDDRRRANEMQVALQRRRLQQQQQQEAANRRQQQMQFEAQQQLAERQQGQREESFQFEREQFEQTMPLRERQVQVQEQQEERLRRRQLQGEGVDPTEHPAFIRASERAKVLEDQLERIEDEINEVAPRNRYTNRRSPAEGSQQRFQQLQSQRQKIAQDLAEVQQGLSGYLEGTRQQFDEAQRVGEALRQERTGEGETPRNVEAQAEQIASDLPSGATEEQIVSAVIEAVGMATATRDRALVRDLVKAVMQKVQQ